MNWSHVFGDEERGRMLEVGADLRSLMFGIEWGPIDYSGSEGDWSVKVRVGPFFVSYVKLSHYEWFGQPPHVRTCRGCGCTDLRACRGGCSWVEDDLCSVCHDKAYV